MSNTFITINRHEKRFGRMCSHFKVAIFHWSLEIVSNDRMAFELCNEVNCHSFPSLSRARAHTLTLTQLHRQHNSIGFRRRNSVKNKCERCPTNGPTQTRSFKHLLHFIVTIRRHRTNETRCEEKKTPTNDYFIYYYCCEET